MKFILALRLWYWEVKAFQYQMVCNDKGFDLALAYRQQARMDLLSATVLTR